jgi:GT2 family glycosyltransferase
MFWRRRVWDGIGGMEVKYHYALDWEFMLRAQSAGFKFARLRRFLACFRVHDEQKTTKNYEIGRREMQTLRLRSLGRVPTHSEIYRAMLPYLARQFIFHWSYRLGLLKQ